MQPNLERRTVIQWLEREYSGSQRPSIWSLCNYVRNDQREYSLLLWIRPSHGDLALHRLRERLKAYLVTQGYEKGEILLAQQMPLA